MDHKISIDLIPETKAQFAECLESKLWRMNNLYRVIDEASESVIFRMRWAQLDFAQRMHMLNVILKSRQHGFSTFIDLWILDDMIFVSNLTCGIVAHTLKHAQKLYRSKLKYPLEQLQDALPDLVPDVVKNDACEIILGNNSSVSVGTSFRSDTIHRLHVSELGKICAKYPARAEEIKTGTMPAVHPQLGCRAWIESTAEGPAGDFYDLCQDARAATQKAKKDIRDLSALEWAFYFYGWHEDPKNTAEPIGEIKGDTLRYFADLSNRHSIVLDSKQEAWYAIKKDGSGGLRSKMKQEHPSNPDEAFEQSVEGAVYAEEMDEAYEQGRIRKVYHDKTIPVYTFWDFGISKGNATVCLFVQFIQDEIRIIDYLEVENRAMVYVAPIVLAKDYTYAPNEPFCYIPHDGKKRDQITGRPIQDGMETLGLRTQLVEAPREKEKDGIDIVKSSIWPRVVIDNSRGECKKVGSNTEYYGCDRLIKCLSWYRWPWDENLNMWGRLPIHDWSSNGADGLQTLGLAYKFHEIGGKYIGDNSVVAAYHGDIINPIENYSPLTYRPGARA